MKPGINRCGRWSTTSDPGACASTSAAGADRHDKAVAHQDRAVLDVGVSGGIVDAGRFADEPQHSPADHWSRISPPPADRPQYRPHRGPLEKPRQSTINFNGALKMLGQAMSYLENIRLFIRIFELGSITAGGRDNRLTPAVASNRIKALEAQPRRPAVQPHHPQAHPDRVGRASTRAPRCSRR